MKKWNVWTKLRSALRDIYRFSPQRRAAIDAVKQKDPELGGWGFECILCHREWPIKMANVDHQPAVGKLSSWSDLEQFAIQLFEGPVRVICLICHKKVTASQRRIRCPK
jgi:hypothetical protein